MSAAPLFKSVTGALLAVIALLVGAAAPATAVVDDWGRDRIDQRSLPLDGGYVAPGDGTGVTVYLIDTGLDVNNAQFAGRATKALNLTGTDVADCVDEMGVGHGTFVAGIAGGQSTGVANQASLVSLQALGCTEGGSTMTVAQQRTAVVRALKWLRRNAVKPSVVNMSLTFDGSTRVDNAVRRLIDSGVQVVAAAGNESAGACSFSPARVKRVITVGASTRRDRAWRASNQGSCVDIWAPGKDITSVLAEGGVFIYEGVGATSWATPFVSGAVALFLQDNPQANPAQVRRAIRESATNGAISGVRPGTTDRLLFVPAS